MEMLRTWKVETTARGAVLWINGKAFDLGSSGHAVAFDIERAAAGWNGRAEAIAKWAAANQEMLQAAEHHARMTALGKAMESMRELEAKLAEAQAAVGEAFVRVRDL